MCIEVWSSKNILHSVSLKKMWNYIEQHGILFM